ncbi:MAG: VWA domain-containing protein [Deltaproteobacteria bacterium]|nr:VWA domain-containing protein [Deltaproteobacteria bacterium]
MNSTTDDKHGDGDETIDTENGGQSDEKDTGEAVDSDSEDEGQDDDFDSNSDKERENEDEDTGQEDDLDSDSGAFEACETLSSQIDRVFTRVMLLEDKSSSMMDNNKWDTAKQAIDAMVTAYENDIEFGLDLFPRGTSLEDVGDENVCSVGDVVIHDVSLNNASTINDELENTMLSISTPLLLAMLNYTNSDYAPAFLDGSSSSYLVIISDGTDSCGGGPGVPGELSTYPSAEQLAEVTTELRDQHGIKTIVIGFGEGADPEQLNAIAAAGGTDFVQYLQADNGEELTDALSQIVEKVVVSCEFEVGGFDNPDVNYDLVMVKFDGEQIPRDDNCKTGKGWRWTNDAHTTIEFCEDACGTLESGDVEGVKVELACNVEQVIVVE